MSLKRDHSYLCVRCRSEPVPESETGAGADERIWDETAFGGV